MSSNYLVAFLSIFSLVIGCVSTTDAIINENLRAPASTPVDPEHVCYPADLKEWNDRPYKEGTIRQVKVTIYHNSNSPEELESVNKGMALVSLFLPEMEDFFLVNYPCPLLVINSWQNKAGGSPGHITIGGTGGVGSAHLLGHELSHSFFGSHNSPAWLSEGTAQFMPGLILDNGEVRKELLQRFGESYGGPQQFYQQVLRTVEKQSIDVNQPLASIPFETDEGKRDNQRYAKSSYGGILFISEIYFVIGKENLGRAYQEMYKHYESTGKKITEKDVEEAVLNNTPLERRPEVKKLIHKKLWGQE